MVFRNFFKIVGNKTGFTLVELITVIAILGILLGIVIPNGWGLLNDWSVKTAAMEIVEDIREVQNLSITTGDDYQFQLNIGQKFYLIKQYDNRIPAIKRVALSPHIQSIRSNLLQQSNYYILSYNALGIPARPGTIWIKSHSGKEIRITIEFVTGRVRLYED